jgi:hypothetical protein
LSLGVAEGAASPLALRDSGGRFAAVDLPETSDLTVGTMAFVGRGCACLMLIGGLRP